MGERIYRLADTMLQEMRYLLTNWRQFFLLSSVIDHEFLHNIVKVAVAPRSDSVVDKQTTNSLVVLIAFRQWRTTGSLASKKSKDLLTFC